MRCVRYGNRRSGSWLRISEHENKTQIYSALLGHYLTFLTYLHVTRAAKMKTLKLREEVETLQCAAVGTASGLCKVHPAVC